MKITAVFLAAMIAAPTGAIADQCQDDITKIDAALAKDNLDADTRAQAEDMRNQAVQLCGAGNEEEGTAVTSEAKALLQVE